MIVKIFLTLDLDEDEYPVPVDGKIHDEVEDALKEFIYDVDGMEIQSIKTIWLPRPNEHAREIYVEILYRMTVSKSKYLSSGIEFL